MSSRIEHVIPARVAGDREIRTIRAIRAIRPKAIGDRARTLTSAPWAIKGRVTGGPSIKGRAIWSRAIWVWVI
jgi:hypothetical protein